MTQDSRLKTLCYARPWIQSWVTSSQGLSLADLSPLFHPQAMCQVDGRQIISSKRKHESSDSTGCIPAKCSRACEHSSKELDVLFHGDTELTCEHPGNQAFADLIMKGIQDKNEGDSIDHIAKLLVDKLTSYTLPTNFFVWNRKSKNWSQLNPSEVLLVTNLALMAAADEQQNVQAELVPKVIEHVLLDVLAFHLDTGKADNVCDSDVAHVVTDTFSQGFPPDHCQTIPGNANDSHDVRRIDPESTDSSLPVDVWDEFL